MLKFSRNIINQILEALDLHLNIIEKVLDPRLVTTLTAILVTLEEIPAGVVEPRSQKENPSVSPVIPVL